VRFQFCRGDSKEHIGLNRTVHISPLLAPILSHIISYLNNV
jgi:hypothetical protein